MKPRGRKAGVFLLPLLFIVTAAAAPGRPAPERTLFKNIPPTDPARQVVQTVLASRFYSMRDAFTASEWTNAGYGGAWERARQYFPRSTYLVRPGTFFMTHGYDPDGRLFMEVHESAYLTLCVENRRTFASGAIIGEYGRMLAAKNGLEAAAFREKMGGLEPYFRDEKALLGLRKALGESLFTRLLEELRGEDYHMIAGGLMHEGMHAGMDEALAARLQAGFSAGERKVQWDELRAFMAEIGYHAAYGRWAAGDIAGLWRRIEGLLGDLEGLRKRPTLRPGSDQARFEAARARAGAHAALVRLRMREVWQSARRMQDLAAGFRRDYVKSAPPAEIGDLLARLDRDTGGFAAAAGGSIQATELAVRSLEVVLDQWSAWAAARRPFPPPITDSQAILKQIRDIRWPDPARDAAAALMKRAGEEIVKERVTS
ncbi:MAG TPA: hypothetical protein VKT17_07615 [Acidobacteriota bacterium]|nr:hypothetical protein [Acidobacteriota bacterium]